MLKFLFAGRRAPGRTRAGALRHLRDIHGPMVVSPPPDAGAMPADYVQNHVFDGFYPAEGPYAIERDLITELWFESLADMQAAVSTPYYLANLRPDEPRFVDDATVAKMRVDPVVRIDGPAGSWKSFTFLSFKTDQSPTAADRGRVVGEVAALNGVVKFVENIVQPAPDGRGPFVDLVLESWFDTKEMAVGALENLGDLFSTSGGGTIDRSRSFAVGALEYDRLTLANLHLNSADGFKG